MSQIIDSRTLFTEEALAWTSSSASLETRKRLLLSSLKGTSRKYKRFLGSPIRYGGGKSLAVGHIVEMIPNNTKRLVSPFLGGGSLEVACATRLHLPVIAYDIFDILTDYWQVQLNDPKGLYRILSQWKPEEKQYTEIKQRLTKYWKKESKMSKKQLAAHYFFNHNLSYGPGFLGWMSKIYKCSDRYQTMIERVRNFKSNMLTVEHADFRDSIANHEGEFLYCDPPYYLDGDSKMFRGIYPQRNFPIHHAGFDHQALRDMLQARKGGFILSYNDCSTIRKWYSDFKIVEVAWQYTMGQGETRIGLNRINDNRDHVKKSHEILIFRGS